MGGVQAVPMLAAAQGATPPGVHLLPGAALGTSSAPGAPLTGRTRSSTFSTSSPPRPYGAPPLATVQRVAAENQRQLDLANARIMVADANAARLEALLEAANARAATAEANAELERMRAQWQKATLSPPPPPPPVPPPPPLPTAPSLGARSEASSAASVHSSASRVPSRAPSAPHSAPPLSIADASASDGTLSMASYSLKPIDRLPTATTTAHLTQLEPLKVDRWLRLFRQRVSSHDTRVRDLLLLPEAEWEALEAKSALGGDLTPSEAGLLLANEWLPAAFLDCLDPKSVHVENFKDELSDTTIADGRALLRAAAQTAVLKVASEHELAEEDFDALRFKVGTSPEEARRDALDFIRRFTRLPSRYNAANPASVRMMLIKKMPDAVSAKRKDLREKLTGTKGTM